MGRASPLRRAPGTSCPAARLPRGRHRARGGPAGFTLLEVLVALAVLAIALVTLYQAFTSTVYVNTVSEGLWKAILYANNDLARWERRYPPPPVGVQQGTFDAKDPMAGYSWRREVIDEQPFPGITVRKIQLELRWEVAGSAQVYRSEIYVSPQ